MVALSLAGCVACTLAGAGVLLTGVASVLIVDVAGLVEAGVLPDCNGAVPLLLTVRVLFVVVVLPELLRLVPEPDAVRTPCALAGEPDPRREVVPDVLSRRLAALVCSKAYLLVTLLFLLVKELSGCCLSKAFALLPV
jgi:hypothetical protein